MKHQAVILWFLWFIWIELLNIGYPNAFAIRTCHRTLFQPFQSITFRMPRSICVPADECNWLQKKENEKRNKSHYSDFAKPSPFTEFIKMKNLEEHAPEQTQSSLFDSLWSIPIFINHSDGWLNGWSSPFRIFIWWYCLQKLRLVPVSWWMKKKSTELTFISGIKHLFERDL